VTPYILVIVLFGAITDRHQPVMVRPPVAVTTAEFATEQACAEAVRDEGAHAECFTKSAGKIDSAP
jgi:hypothetical protein